MIGRTIGQYQVIDKIGEGGMGAVYKAEDTTLHRLVALKTLAHSLSNDPEAKERFVREAQAASALNHPNITTVFELVQDKKDNSQIICMEYVEGKTVRDMVESGRVGVKKAVEVVLQTAKALGTAHQKGILHRDIKSSNIMVTMEGRVKVLDFGLAHLEERSQLTRTGTTLGTLSYSSPEQITGAGYDQRSEIWALGVVLYELLTAQLPFSSASEGELVFSIINNEQEPPTRLREDIPESVERILLRMLEKDPSERYQNCSELISDLIETRGSLETSTLTRTSQAGIRKMQFKPAILTTISTLLVISVGILFATRSHYEPGSALIIQFQDRTRDDSLAFLSQGGPEQIRQLLNESGLVSGIDFHWFETESESIISQQSLTERQILRIAREHRADLIITASYQLEGEEVVLRPVIFSRSRDKSWSLSTIRMPKSETTRLLSTVCDRIGGMTASIQDEEYRVLNPLIGFPPSTRAYQSMREGFHVFFNRTLRDAIPIIEQVALEYPEYDRPLLWLARWAVWVDNKAELDSILAVIEERDITLDFQAEAFIQLMQESLGGNRDSCYRAAKYLQQLAPGTYWNYEVAKWANFTQRPREALRMLDGIYPEGFLLRNSINATRFMKSLAYHKLGMHEEAFQAVVEIRDHPELNPSLYYEVLSLGALGRLDDIMARFEESKSRTTIRENANVPVIIPGVRSPGGILVAAGVRLREYDYPLESQEALNQAINWYSAEDPEYYKPSIAEANYWAEEWEEAGRQFSELADDDPENLSYKFRLGAIAARTGDREQARDIYHQLLSEDLTRSDILFALASLSALLGDKDTAVQHLQDSLDHRLNWRDDIKRNIDLESLRGYPPFENIFKLIG
ncbi:protein kinase [Gemmatimonadota bacterium]